MEDTQFFSSQYQPAQLTINPIINHNNSISNEHRFDNNNNNNSSNQFVYFSFLNGGHNPNAALLTSTSWSSSSSSGLEENYTTNLYDYDSSIAIEIAPSNDEDISSSMATNKLSKTGSQMMLVETTSSSNLLSLMTTTTTANNNDGNDLLSVQSGLDDHLIDSFSMDPNIQLWQFLIECLEDPYKRYHDIIRWTNNTMSPTPPPPSSPSPPTRRSTTTTTTTTTTKSNDHAMNEFCILDPRELAKRWSIRRAMASKTVIDDELIYLHPAYIQRFNRVMRYYHNKKRVLYKLVGKPNTYAFLINIQPYLSMLRARHQHQQQQQQDRMLV